MPIFSPVQPRGCGEHGVEFGVVGRPVGSAPRVRGTREAADVVPLHGRFSPAGAGNTVSAVLILLRNSVQPRGCGEHGCSLFGKIFSFGSAPRVRGTPGTDRQIDRGLRFSPAGAGNTCLRPTSRTPAPVQPRGCGEHCVGQFADAVNCGSAPRVRGTLCNEWSDPWVFRFSPAGAGNTR